MSEEKSGDYQTHEPEWIHGEEAGSTPISAKQRLWLTIGLIIMVPFSLWAGWFEFGRAEGGNWRAWVYTFEWPFFAVIAIYLYRRLLYGQMPKIPRPDLEALALEAEKQEE